MTTLTELIDRHLGSLRIGTFFEDFGKDVLRLPRFSYGPEEIKAAYEHAKSLNIGEMGRLAIATYGMRRDTIEECSLEFRQDFWSLMEVPMDTLKKKQLPYELISMRRKYGSDLAGALDSIKSRYQARIYDAINASFVWDRGNINVKDHFDENLKARGDEMEKVILISAKNQSLPTTNY